MNRVETEFREAIKQKSKEIPQDGAPLLYFQANGRLYNLLQLAGKGDRQAARYLLSVLTANVERFLNFCAQNQNFAREMRFPGAPWPLLHTHLKVNPRAECLTVPSDHILRKLGVIRKGKTLSEKAIGTAAAWEFYRDMDFYRIIQSVGCTGRDATHAEQIKRIRDLQPLCRSNYVEWWKEAEPLLLKKCGPEFQDDEKFKKWPNAAYRGLSAEAERSAKRSDIKRAIKRGFESLAKHLHPKMPNHPG